MAAIVQVFEISPELQMGLAQGIYKVWGGVVRYAVGPNKGQIVKHLKPIDLPEAANAAPAIGKKVIDVVKNNRNVVIVGGVIIAVAVAGAGIHYVTHKKSKEELDFRLSLNNYIDAVRCGTLDTEKIDTLVNAVNVLKTRNDYYKIKMELSVQQLDVLVNQIHDYTIQLAEDNNVKLFDHESREFGGNEDTIICLARFLNAQKRILNAAA